MIEDAVVRPFKYVKKVQNKLVKESSALIEPLKSRRYELLYSQRNRLAESEKYFESKTIAAKTSDTAVVLHLYYTEGWDEIFKKKLLTLAKDCAFDLCVTLPTKNSGFADEILKSFPRASIFVMPNRGRDVLPFLKTAAVLRDRGYKRVLKMHSKKSTHRSNAGNAAESGDEWLVNTVSTLIPEDRLVRKKVIDLVGKQQFGVLGPEKYYYPLKMYLTRNRRALEVLMANYKDDLFKGDTARKLDGYGYFGGTMFWLNLEVIEDLLSISKDNFEEERGQTDGTLAHAVERALSVLPQLKGKKVYGVTSTKVTELKSARTPDWYSEDAFISSGRPHISIIVPVYGDWPSLSINIRSLRGVIGNREDAAVYFVNDCGPEADELELKIKSAISGMANFYYVRNKKNLGFVKNCNNAVFKIVPQEDDVLLLNSDTRVTNGFMDHMRDVLYAEEKIAAVTARSNNATIWSVPMNARLADQRGLSYALYRLIKPKLPSYYESPTVHGFCVLIRRTVIEKYGLFDEIYGKGYGEENDFAMRVRSKGWKCAVSNYSFVFHYESRSFGNEARRIQIETNEKILLKRYPDYRQQVQKYWDSIKEPLK